MPDFDIDFCQDGRDRVIDYVRRKYGADRVAQIITFGTLKGKQAIKEGMQTLRMAAIEKMKKGEIPFEQVLAESA